jgi:thiamine transport system permease protein
LRWRCCPGLSAADVHPALAAFAARGAGQFSVGLLADSYLQWRIVWSLLQAAASCVAALLVGLPLAWCLARYQFPGRSLTLRLLMLPFVMPTLVAGMGVLALFGPQGLLGINLQDTPWLLLYGNLFFNLPLVIRAACEGLSLIPASRIAAARTLGATPWRVFWQVEWPAVRPWLWSALCLVFCIASPVLVWRCCWVGSVMPRWRWKSTSWWLTS